MLKEFLNRRFFGIRAREILITLVIYTVFAFLYHVTLWVNRMGYKDPDDHLFDMEYFVLCKGMQYVIFFLLTIPLWFLNFRWLKNWPLLYKLLLHLVTLPVFVFVSQRLYYAYAEAMGYWHLQGSGQVWDIYIPGLFYCFQFGLFHAYQYFTENQKKLKLEGELRNAALKSELSAIKAQLNPHFLYNVFNTINASVPAENEKTRHLIAELSDLFRYQLQASQEEVVTLEEELNFVQKYLALEKERFGDRLQIELNVDKNLYSEKIPPMILQPLVENSVKHGLSSLIDGGTISITIFKDGDKLRFEIADTGVGAKDKSKLFEKGVGLTNTRMRLQKMYKTNLEVIDNHPQGLKIKFSI
ncbi:histidine kinase [Aureisphaera galaxeae]|uniref:sensor histidine kinase n=1 Tax=Aureisphaera galaxeae TaxID=1538023 RepID=UPI0023503216|nr:histidine kinase [Aureisphaera galaxeae]MDC8003581.1 histidine kinase [Aureisphaera galaxeae]